MPDLSELCLKRAVIDASVELPQISRVGRRIDSVFTRILHVLEGSDTSDLRAYGRLVSR